MTEDGYFEKAEREIKESFLRCWRKEYKKARTEADDLSKIKGVKSIYEMGKLQDFCYKVQKMKELYRRGVLSDLLEFLISGYEAGLYGPEEMDVANMRHFSDRYRLAFNIQELLKERAREREWFFEPSNKDVSFSVKWVLEDFIESLKTRFKENMEPYLEVKDSKKAFTTKNYIL